MSEDLPEMPEWKMAFHIAKDKIRVLEIMADLAFTFHAPECRKMVFENIETIQKELEIIKSFLVSSEN